MRSFLFNQCRNELKLREDAKRQTAILKYWFGSKPHTPTSIESKRKIWYAGNEEIDAEIRSKFEEDFERACREVNLHWGESAEGSLALVILLDQFSRNLHRDSIKAYEQDPLARAVAKRAIKSGFDRTMSVPERVFLLHPFHHSESVTDQQDGCTLLRELELEGHAEWASLIQSSIEWFESHRATVERFGRFPHRNHILNRNSTDDELAFLATKGKHF